MGKDQAREVLQLLPMGIVVSRAIGSGPHKTQTKNIAENAKKSRMSFKEKFELDNMETTIAKLEEEIAELTKQSQDPKVFAEHKKI